MKDESIDHLFRTEYGKLVSTLTRFFGPSHIQLAEDTVQDALITALNKWSLDGVPDNPSGWLFQVAKRKALNELKRTQIKNKHQEEIINSLKAEQEPIMVYSQDEIEDSQLRMIFTCCNPMLKIESQIALTLKTLCGFGIPQVAQALLTTKDNINKRLYRAKTTIRNSKIPFQIPLGPELSSRLHAVSTTLYLMFNEGYNLKSDNLIQKDFCLESMRLTKLLVKRFTEFPELNALLALMCFHISRFEARQDFKGGIIIFEDQDRSVWNKDLISMGMQYLAKSKKAETISSFHLEAGIAAQHCLAPSFQETNWNRIYEYYLHLEKLKPNPIIKLNMAIVTSQLSGYEKGIEVLEKLEENKTLSNYYLLPVTQGTFLFRLRKFKKAIRYFQLGLDLNPSKKEIDFIQNNITLCKNALIKKS